jgi:hypothetical protein
MTLTDKNKVTAKSRNTVVIIAGVIGLILLWWFYPQIRAAMDPVREVSSVEDSVIPAAETSDAAAEPNPVADIETATDSPNEEDAVAVPDPATSEAASADTASESQSAETSSDAPAEPLSSKLAAPKFDVVRIEANGSALIAGQADGRGYVVLSIDGVEQPEARADLSGNGQFVIFAFLPPTADQRSLKLHLYTEDGSGPIASVQTVFVAPATAVSSGTESTSAEVEEEVAASEDQEAETEMASTDAKSTNLEADAAPVAEADAAPVAEADAAPVAEADAAPVAEADAAPVAEADAAPVAEADAAPVAEADAAPVAENVTAPKVSEPESDMGSIDTGSTNAEADSTPTTVILADEDGVRVLQDGAPTEVTPAVAIDTISYSSNGGVILGGRGQAGNFVRIYLNNQYIATSGIAVDGYWALELSDIEPGIYTLRIDELNLAGDVVSRAETPFKREAAEDLAELMAMDTEVEEPLIEVPSESAAVVKAEAADAQPAVQTETETAPEKPLAQAVTQVEVNVQPEVAELDGQDEQSSNGGSAVVEGLPAETALALRAPSKKFRVRTVQPGSTLWAIAKESYGAGIEYFKVFEANKERIRDPDLIYPGQVFEIPD